MVVVEIGGVSLLVGWLVAVGGIVHYISENEDENENANEREEQN